MVQLALIGHRAGESDPLAGPLATLERARAILAPLAQALKDDDRIDPLDARDALVDLCILLGV